MELFHVLLVFFELLKIKFLEQDRPKGLPDAFIVGEKFIGQNSVVLILGDNFFYGQSLTQKLKKCIW